MYLRGGCNTFGGCAAESTDLAALKPPDIPPILVSCGSFSMSIFKIFASGGDLEAGRGGVGLSETGAPREDPQVPPQQLEGLRLRRPKNAPN